MESRDLIFISFRGDNQGWARALHKDLEAHFGADRVFRSSESLTPGRPYPQQLKRAIRRTCVMIALVDDNFAGPALHTAGDWVRYEIAESLRADIPVIPLLINGARLPTADNLPEELRPIATHQTLSLRKRNEAADINELLRRLPEAAQHLRTALVARRGRGPVILPEEAELDRAADRLAEAVADQWRAEAATMQLIRPQPLDLTFTHTSGEQRLHDIAAVYRGLPHGQLVVLGGPGAGKTSAVILLVLALLEDRDLGDPVPVILPLSAWNPLREHLRTWMAQQIGLAYPGAGPAVARLLGQGRILPVLDGLDEIAPDLRQAAVDGIGHAVAGGLPVVVTCRDDDYAALAHPLPGVPVITMQPVAVRAALAYLPHGWHDEDAVPLNTPLLVHLARGTDPHTLRDQDDIEEFLLAGYLPGLYPEQPLPPAPGQRPRHPYQPEQVRAWLSYLAAADEDYYAWWRLWLRVPKTLRAVIVGLSATPLFIVGLVWSGSPAFIILGLIFAVFAGSPELIGKELPEGPLRDAMIRWQRVPQRLTLGHMSPRRLIAYVVTWAGTAGGVTAALTALAGLPGAQVAAAAALVAAASTTVGLTFTTVRPAHAAQAATSASTLSGDRSATLWLISGTSTAFGLIMGAGAAVWPDPNFTWLSGGAGMAIFWAAISTPMFFGHLPWPGYTTIRTLLAVCGKLPLRLQRFLDDAHDRGVLVQVGPVYKFRHDRLRNYLRRQP